MSEKAERYGNQVAAIRGELIRAGADFLRHFEVGIDPLLDPENFKQAMRQLNPRYQGERPLVRWELEADQRQWDAETQEVIRRTADQMGMLKAETPLVGQYDIAVAFGAARRATEPRAMGIADAIVEGRAQVKQLIVAGSGRELDEKERTAVADYAPGARTEFDLCVVAARNVGVQYPGMTVGLHYVPNPKAHTEEVMRSVLSQAAAAGNLPEGARIAASTQQLYQPWTALDVARVGADFGAADTFTAGVASEQATIQMRTPATYLAEVTRAMVAVADAA